MPNYIHSDRGASFLSRELKEYLTQRGIATSRTTPYHPIGNGQAERYNGIIWKAVRLALESTNLPVSSWELVLPDALHSIRSLLSTATNTTPHERFFNFQRRSSHGTSLPSWLHSPGPVLLRRFVRTSKNDPLVDEVEVTSANPSYAHVKYKDGRESTVSLRDLAPCPPTLLQNEAPEAVPSDKEKEQSTPTPTDPPDPEQHPVTPMPTVLPDPEERPITPTPTAPPDSKQRPIPQATELRRSSRQVKPPSRYGW